VTVTLSPRHSGRVEGLCGDFDGNANNDFHDLLSGQIAATPNDFARLWKTSPSCPDSDVPQDFDPCAVSFRGAITTFGLNRSVFSMPASKAFRRRL